MHEDVELLIDKLDRIQKECSDKANKNKLGSIRRYLKSLDELICRVVQISELLNDENEVDWFYGRYKELKQEIKR